MTNPLAQTRKYNIQLNPVNSTSSGDYSPGAGLPLIKFDISSTEMPTNLDLSQLRINGTITYFTGNVPAVPTQVANNIRAFRDCYTGDLSNCIDHVSIASKKLSSVIERVNNYSRLVPTIITGNHGPVELNSQLWNQGGMCTDNFIARNLVVANANSTGVASTANSYGKDFSMPLYCGLLNSDRDLDISVNGSGGLTIEILLKPNVSACFGVDAAAAQIKYKVSNLLLTVPAYELSGQTAAAALAADRVFNFNSISSVFQTLNSSTAVIALTPGLSRVSSVMINGINAAEIGNQNMNSNRLSNLGRVRELRFSKNGIMHPNQFRLYSDVQTNNLIAAAQVAGTVVVGSVQTLQGRAMIDVDYLEAVSTNPIGSTGRTMIAYNTYQDSIKNRTQTQNNGGNAPGSCGGQGILFDAYGSGDNFQQMVFSCEFDNSTINGTAGTSMGVYLYFLNQNSLIMSTQGLSVQN